MKLYHLNIITRDNTDQVNREGWGVAPWSTHADITMNKDRQAAAMAYVEGGYKQVAEISDDAWKRQVGEDAKEYVFRVTQNLTPGGWIQDAQDNDNGVLLCETDGQRSTSVGDIIEDGGEYYLVDSFGFTLIEQLSKEECDTCGQHFPKSDIQLGFCPTCYLAAEEELGEDYGNV